MPETSSSPHAVKETEYTHKLSRLSIIKVEAESVV